MVDNMLEKGLNIATSHNHYTLSVVDLLAAVSILFANGETQPNEITFTGNDKSIVMGKVLTQSASFSFNPQNLSDSLARIRSLEKPVMLQALYSVLSGFIQYLLSPLKRNRNKYE